VCPGGKTRQEKAGGRGNDQGGGSLEPEEGKKREVRKIGGDGPPTAQEKDGQRPRRTTMDEGALGPVDPGARNRSLERKGRQGGVSR